MTIRTAVIAVLALAVAASACGRSEFSYIEQDDDGVFLKVPDDWSVFDTTRTEEGPQLLGDLFVQPIGGVATPWQVVFDGGPQPTASNINVPLYGFPVGLAEVQPIEPQARDGFSTEIMRSIATGFQFDPVAQASEAGSEVVVEFDRDITQDNLRGNRVRFSRPVDGGAIVVDSLVLADGTNTRWYRLTLACEETCFLANADVIDEVMASFTVEP